MDGDCISRAPACRWLCVVLIAIGLVAAFHTCAARAQDDDPVNSQTYARGAWLSEPLVFERSFAAPAYEFDPQAAPTLGEPMDSRQYETYTEPTPTPGEITVNADYTARGAVVADSKRLANFASGTFLPSAIPAFGQPFYDNDGRANVQGDGSAFSLTAATQRRGLTPGAFDLNALLYAEVSLQNFSVGTAETGEASVVVSEVFGRFNRLTVGISESEFSDRSALPEVLDRAGPNARLTVFDAGVGKGQGLISYEFLSDEPEGFEIIGSVEQAIPEINSPPGDEAFAHYPDLILVTQYVSGDRISWDPQGKTTEFYERWHVQWASIARDLGSELPTGVDQNEFGWGTALSGAYRFSVNPRVQHMDRVMFSTVYGKGISHYVADLNAATDTGDAVINSAGELEALPVFGAYAAYTHQWTDNWRSTATLSHVNLDSVNVLATPGSPYHSGEFAAVNLVYHVILTEDKPGKKGERFYSGIEYLYGQKETLDGSDGEAHRLLFLIALRK